MLRNGHCASTLSHMDIKDPATFRAMAHPLRLELFERLAILGSATASQLADLVDESPANCSFHLRVLAKHGYIERVESGDGRERPWRVLDVTQTWDSDQPDETRLAKETLEDTLREWDNARLRIARRTPNPDEWKGTLLSSSATLWLTPAEAKALGEGIAALIMPYVQRWENDERIEGGAPVRVLADTFLVPGRMVPDETATETPEGDPS